MTPSSTINNYSTLSKKEHLGPSAKKVDRGCELIFSNKGVLQSKDIFEIYKIKTGVDFTDLSNFITNYIEPKSFFFIADKRDDLNKNIILDHLPEKIALNNRVYLIREGKTIRFANEREIKILNSSELEQDCIQVMKESYGRLATAYHRASQRYPYLVELYNTIFDFSLQNSEMTIEYMQKLQQYQEYYVVKLNSKSFYLSLKKVLEVLQVFNFPICNDDKRDGSKPIQVFLKIGNTEYNFVVSRSQNKKPEEQLNQVIISTFDEQKQIFIAHSYTYLLGVSDSSKTIHRRALGIKPSIKNACQISKINISDGTINSITDSILAYEHKTDETQQLLEKENNLTLDQVLKTFSEPFPNNNNWSEKFNVEDEKRIAECIATYLDAKINQQPNFSAFEGLDVKIRQQIIELIAITQIAEANHGDNYNYTRTLGMNKLARGIFWQIAKGKSTFKDAFNIIENRSRKIFPPIGPGGASRARAVVQNIQKDIYDVKTKIIHYGATCELMSDDSEIEPEEFKSDVYF